jgi:hypothetical protein
MIVAVLACTDDPPPAAVGGQRQLRVLLVQPHPTHSRHILLNIEGILLCTIRPRNFFTVFTVNAPHAANCRELITVGGQSYVWRLPKY